MAILLAIKQNIINGEYIYNIFDVLCRIYLSYYKRIRQKLNIREKDKIPIIFRMKNFYLSKRIPKLIPNTIKKYNSITTLNTSEADKKIWICWLQGEERMPDIVKLCYQSVKDNANGYKVQLVTEDWLNKNKIVSEDLMGKWHSKVIGNTLFSDVIRHELLSRRGGIWLDATCYVTQPISMKLLNYSYYSAKNLKKFPMWFQYIFTEEWTSYFLVSKKKSYTECFLRDALYEYWENHNYMLDYLLQNYIAKYGRENIKEIKDEYKLIPTNNQYIEEYGTKMNEVIDIKKFKKRKEVTSIFKLTYKNELKNSSKGEPTFYEYIKKRTSIGKCNNGNL